MGNETVGRKDEKWSTSFGLINLIPFSSHCLIELQFIPTTFLPIISWLDDELK